MGHIHLVAICRSLQVATNYPIWLLERETMVYLVLDNNLVIIFMVSG